MVDGETGMPISRNPMVNAKVNKIENISNVKNILIISLSYPQKQCEPAQASE